MTTLRSPFSVEAGGGSSRPSVGAGVAVVAATAGAVGLVLLGGFGALGALAVAVLVGLTGAIYALYRHPAALMPAAVMMMWFEFGRGQVSTGRIFTGLALSTLVLLIVTTPWRPPALMVRGWIAGAPLVLWSLMTGFWSVKFGTWALASFAWLISVTYLLIFAWFTKGVDHLRLWLERWVWVGAANAVVLTVPWLIFGRRVQGFNGNANAYASYLVMALPLITMMIHRRRGAARWRAMALLIPYVFMLILSGSRMGLICAGFMGMYCLVTYPGVAPVRRLVTGVVGVIGMAGAYLVALLLNPERLSLAGFVSDKGAGRLEVWNAGLSVLPDHWVAGLGLGQFKTQSIDLMQKVTGGSFDAINQPGVRSAGTYEIHNQYLGIILEMGVVGAVCYAFLIGMLLWNLWHMRRTEWREMIWFFFGVILVLHLEFMFGTQLNDRPLWMILGVSATWFVRRREAPGRAHTTAIAAVGPAHDAR